MNRGVIVLVSVFGVGGLAVAAAPPIPFPHPVITEMLFNVPPKQLESDANQDGFRSSIGDEFVELYNPHDRAIDVSAYSVSDDHPSDRYRLEFEIPAGTRLEPGQTLVIFNGHKQGGDMPTPYGDRRTTAAGPNAAFHGAIVYSIKNISGSRAWANNDDMVVLRAPDGQVIDVIVWGRPEHQPPASPLRITRVEDEVPFSYQRLGAWGLMLPHVDVDGRRFSPGEVLFEQTITVQPEPAAPAGPAPNPR